MNKYLSSLLIAIVVLPVCASASTWAGPTQTPPNGNVDTPINVGSSAQIKSGGLSVGAFIANSISYLVGNTGIGIGLTTPRQMLSVGNYLDLYSGNANNPTVASIRASSAGNLVLNGATNGNVYLNNDTGVNTFILGSGNVGINTTSPISKLHIVANTSNTGSESAAHGISIAAGSSGRTMTMGYDGTADVGYINVSKTGSYQSLVLQSRGGKVGIGTVAPGAALEVAGQVKITGGTPGAGKVLTSDASGLASWTTPSTGLTSEADTLDSVTGRSGSTYNAVSVRAVTINGGDDAATKLGQVGYLYRSSDDILLKNTSPAPDGTRYFVFQSDGTFRVNNGNLNVNGNYCANGKCEKVINSGQYSVDNGTVSYYTIPSDCPANSVLYLKARASESRVFVQPANSTESYLIAWGYDNDPVTYTMGVIGIPVSLFGGPGSSIHFYAKQAPGDDATYGGYVQVLSCLGV